MKTQTLLPCLICVGLPLAHAEDKNKPIPRKPPTHADLAKRKAEQAQKKIVRIETSDKPLVKKSKPSLIASSTLLASGKYWTLVPRGAVIHIPERYKDKIVSKPTGELLEWKKFLRKNQGWIQTQAVTMKQAQGKTPLDEEAIHAYQSIGKVVVATCANGPISVAHKPAETEADKESVKNKEPVRKTDQ